VERIASPIGTATKVFEPRFFRATELLSQSEGRGIELEPMNTRLVGTE
jgi:hypothetical protein